MIKNSNKKEKRIQLDFVDKIIDNYLLKIFCKENKIDFTEESSVEIEEQNKNINENENKEDLKINKITLTKQLTQKQQNEFESFKHDFKSQFPRKEAKYDEVLNPEVQKLLQEGVEIDYDILCDKTIADIDNTYSYNYLILERNVLLDLITNKYQGDDLKQKIEEFKKLPFETKNNNKIKTFITENNMINTHVLDAFLQVRLSEDFVKMAIILNEIDNDKNFTLKQLHIDIFNSFLEKSNDILQKNNNSRNDLLNNLNWKNNNNNLKIDLEKTLLLLEKKIKFIETYINTGNDIEANEKCKEVLSEESISNNKYIEDNDKQTLKYEMHQHYNNIFLISEIITNQHLANKYATQNVKNKINNTQYIDEDVLNYLKDKLNYFKQEKEKIIELTQKITHCQDNTDKINLQNDVLNNKILVFDKTTKQYKLTKQINDEKELNKIKQSIKTAIHYICNNIINKLSYVDLNKIFGVKNSNRNETIKYLNFQFDLLAKSCKKTEQWKNYKTEIVEYYSQNIDIKKPYIPENKDEEFYEASKKFFNNCININLNETELKKIFQIQELINITEENNKQNNNFDITEFEKKNAIWESTKYTKMLKHSSQYLQQVIKNYNKHGLDFIANGYTKIITGTNINKKTSKKNKSIIVSIPNNTSILRQYNTDIENEILDTGGNKVLPFDESLMNFMQKICLSAFEYAYLFKKNLSEEEKEKITKQLSIDIQKRLADSNKNNWFFSENNNVNILSNADDIDVDFFIDTIENILKTAYEDQNFWLYNGSFKDEKDAKDFICNKYVEENKELVNKKYEELKKCLEENDKDINNFYNQLNDFVKNYEENYLSEQITKIENIFNTDIEPNVLIIKKILNTYNNIYELKRIELQDLSKCVKSIDNIKNPSVLCTLLNKKNSPNKQILNCYNALDTNIDFFNLFNDTDNYKNIDVLIKIFNDENFTFRYAQSIFQEKNIKDLKSILLKVNDKNLESLAKSMKINNNTEQELKEFLILFKNNDSLKKIENLKNNLQNEINGLCLNAKNKINGTVSSLDNVLDDYNDDFKEPITLQIVIEYLDLYLSEEDKKKVFFNNNYYVKKIKERIQEQKRQKIINKIDNKGNITDINAEYLKEIIDNAIQTIQKLKTKEEYIQELKEFKNKQNTNQININNNNSNIVEIIKNISNEIKKKVDLDNITKIINKFYIIIQAKQQNEFSKAKNNNQINTYSIEKQVKNNIEQNKNIYKDNHKKFKQLFNRIGNIMGQPNGATFGVKFNSIKPYLKNLLSQNIFKITNKTKEEAQKEKETSLNMIIDEANLTNQGELQDKYNELCSEVFKGEKIDFKEINKNYKEIKQKLSQPPKKGSEEYKKDIEDAKKKGYYDFYNKQREQVSTLMMLYGERQGKHYDNNKMQRMNGSWLKKEHQKISGEKLEENIKQQSQKNNEKPKIFAEVEKFDNKKDKEIKNYPFAKDPYSELFERSDNRPNPYSEMYEREALVRWALNLFTIDGHKNNFFYSLDKNNKIKNIDQFDYDYTSPMIPLDLYKKYNKNYPDRIDVLNDEKNTPIVKKEIEKIALNDPLSICYLIKYRSDRTFDKINEDDLKDILNQHILHCCSIIDALCKAKDQNIENEINQNNQFNQMNPMNTMNQMGGFGFNQMNPMNTMNQMGGFGFNQMNPMNTMNQMGGFGFNQMNTMGMNTMNQMGGFGFNQMNPMNPMVMNQMNNINQINNVTEQQEPNFEELKIQLHKDCFYKKYNGKILTIQEFENQNSDEEFVIKIPNDLRDEYKDAINLLAENIKKCVNFIQNNEINVFLNKYKKLEEQEIEAKNMKKLEEKLKNNEIYVIYDNETNTEKKYLEVNNDYYEYSNEKNTKGYNFTLVDKNNKELAEMIKKSIQINGQDKIDNKTIDVNIENIIYNLFEYLENYFYKSNYQKNGKPIYGIFSNKKKVEEEMQKNIKNEINNGNYIEYNILNTDYEIVYKWEEYYVRIKGEEENFKKANTQLQLEIDKQKKEIFKNANKNKIEIQTIEEQEIEKNYYGKLFGKFYKLENDKLTEIKEKEYNNLISFEFVDTINLNGKDVKIYIKNGRFFTKQDNNDKCYIQLSNEQLKTYINNNINNIKANNKKYCYLGKYLLSVNNKGEISVADDKEKTQIDNLMQQIKEWQPTILNEKKYYFNIKPNNDDIDEVFYRTEDDLNKDIPLNKQTLKTIYDINSSNQNEDKNKTYINKNNQPQLLKLKDENDKIDTNIKIKDKWFNIGNKKTTKCDEKDSKKLDKLNSFYDGKNKENDDKIQIEENLENKTTLYDIYPLSIEDNLSDNGTIVEFYTNRNGILERSNNDFIEKYLNRKVDKPDFYYEDGKYDYVFKTTGDKFYGYKIDKKTKQIMEIKTYRKDIYDKIQLLEDINNKFYYNKQSKTLFLNHNNILKKMDYNELSNNNISKNKTFNNGKEEIKYFLIGNKKHNKWFKGVFDENNNINSCIQVDKEEADKYIKRIDPMLYIYNNGIYLVNNRLYISDDGVYFYNANKYKKYKEKEILEKYFNEKIVYDKNIDQEYHFIKNKQNKIEIVYLDGQEEIKDKKKLKELTEQAKLKFNNRYHKPEYKIYKTKKSREMLKNIINENKNINKIKNIIAKDEKILKQTNPTLKYQNNINNKARREIEMLNNLTKIKKIYNNKLNTQNAISRIKLQNNNNKKPILFDKKYKNNIQNYNFDKKLNQIIDKNNHIDDVFLRAFTQRGKNKNIFKS